MIGVFGYILSGISVVIFIYGIGLFRHNESKASILIISAVVIFLLTNYFIDVPFILYSE